MDWEVTSIRYLLLTALSEATRSYDSRPTFHQDIWPFLERNAARIRRVYSFINHFYQVGLFRRRPKEGVIDLGAMGVLDKRTKKHIRDGSHYGWLNVLYEMGSGDAIVQELMQMWRREPELKDDPNALSLTASEIKLLGDLVHNVEATSVIAAFANEGASLFVFGRESALTYLIETQRRAAQK